MTDFLFAKPSALYGFARLLDLGAQLDSYNESPTPAIADFLALLTDWSVVGQDMTSALEHELKERSQTKAA